mgnify:FL=1|tara:strand:- start:2224 stop:2916 length:693 start_codon:yes stop_codon:yes gene_type:complete
MATSGTTTFTLDLGDIMEEAYDLAGLEMRSGYDYRSAKRSLDLIFLEWQNKGLNLFTVVTGTQTLTEGQALYPLPADALEVIDVSLRTDSGDVDNQKDTRLTRISRTQYSHIANKLLKSRPTQFYVQKSSSVNNLVLWATPDNAETYTLVYDYIARIEDTGKPASNNADIPISYLPCLTYALAYSIACKRPQSNERVPMLRMRYDELWNEVADSQRERSNLKLAPNLRIY